MNNFAIFENIISKTHQDYIENLFFSSNFPWYYNQDPTFANQKSDRGTTFSSSLLNENYKSEFVDILLPIAFSCFDKMNIKKESNIFNIRSFLHIKNEIDLLNRKDSLHVDNNFNHLVILYYVNDSDGNTEITNRIFNESTKESEKSEKILKSISPKKGRCVVFDGKYYHRSTHPQYSDRCVVNFNLTL